MRLRIRSTTILMAVVVAANARPMAAQQQEPATVPTSLAKALMFPFFSMFEDQPHFVVERTPDGWPKDLAAPVPAKLVGGAAFGPILSAVYRYPRGVDAVEAYQRVLAHAGFTRGASMGREHGGFSSGQMPEGATWCRADGSADVIVVDSSAATRSLLVTFVSSHTRSASCSPAATQGQEWKPPLAIPALSAPLGVSAQAEGSGWNGNHMSTSVSVDTTMSADSLLDHYARQLTNAGWQTGKQLSDGHTAVRAVSTHDANGQLWSGALTLITAGSRRTILLNMSGAPRE